MRRVGIIVAFLLAAAVVAWLAWRKAPTPGDATEDPSSPAGASATHAATTKGATLPAVIASSPPPAAKDDAARFVPFGDGADALGKGVTPDGHPVAPSSFLATSDGLLVVDQEHGRLWRSNGAPIPLPGKRADDVARADDGSLAVLDRTGGREIAVLDPSGRVKGRIPLAGQGLEEPRDVSRVFVSGSDVLVERNGGGPLLRVGSIDGSPAKERTEIQGVPTRDGKYLASAGVTNEDEGRAWITLADRSAVHLWTRELKYPAALSAVAFLDSEASGTIWAVLLAGSSAADYVDWAVCFDPQTGNLRGSFTIATENPPWESFRDFAVQDGAGLVAAKRAQGGVSYATYRCP